MQLIFTKGSGKYDSLQVCRPGAPVENVACPKQGIIPHDMVHYAVESTLHRRGFIARVGQGDAATLQMAAEPESDGVERLVEVFQADGWSGWSSPPQDLLDLYQTTCAARECPPLAIDPADVQAVREKILQLTRQWQAIGVGQSLSLEF